MTKERLSDFWLRKVHPLQENPGYAYAREKLLRGEANVYRTPTLNNGDYLAYIK